jgi:hypothetical protein
MHKAREVEQRQLTLDQKIRARGYLGLTDPIKISKKNIPLPPKQKYGFEYADTHYDVPLGNRIPTPPPYDRRRGPIYDRFGAPVSVEKIVTSVPAPKRMEDDVPKARNIASISQIANDDRVYFDITTGDIFAVVPKNDHNAILFYDLYFDPMGGATQTVRYTDGESFKIITDGPMVMVTRNGLPSRWCTQEEVESYLDQFNDDVIHLFDVVKKDASFAPLKLNMSRVRIIFSMLGRIKH